MEIIIIGITVFTLSILFNGIVIVNLWKWFIVPLGVMEISFAHALGISILFKFLSPTTMNNNNNNNNNVNLVAGIILVIGYPFISLFIGWIIHLFM